MTRRSSPLRSIAGLDRLAACAVPLLLVLVVASGTSHAKSHLWRFTEIFSDASGSVQFIEMFVFDPAGTAETKFQGFSLSSGSQVYVFPNNLPDENTFQRWVLIATQPFADLPGAPVPDFIIPEGFFDPNGDELRYRTNLDIFTFASGDLPTDGLHSLLTNSSTPVNSPTNFAGVMGSVFVPAPVPSLDPWAIAILVVAMTTMAVVMLRTYRGGSPRP